jgi:DNA-binding transcriptional regulator YiaG
MAGPSEPGRDLASWKEIADYLGVSVRAAQKWEQERGLPVKRLPGRRSGVSARVEALDAWRKSGEAAVAAPVLSNLRWWVIATVIILSAFTAVLLAWVRHRDPPASFRVEPSRLVVLNAAGRELWRASFDEPLNLEAYSSALREEKRRFWTGDLNGDGSKRVLFAKTPSGMGGSSYLVCFDERGVEQWRFRPGRPVSSPVESFADTFAVANFMVAPLGPDGANEIIVTSVQLPYYPDQVVLLSRTGKVLSEYWHSGYLEHIAVMGHDIYLAGVSNGYHAGTLVVLGAGRLSGASVEPDGDHQLQGFAAAAEKARVFFPRTCINRKFEQYNFAIKLNATPESITVLVAERRPQTPAIVWYHLSPALQLVHVEPTDAFRSYHAEQRAARLLDHDLTPAEEARLSAIRVIRNRE